MVIKKKKNVKEKIKKKEIKKHITPINKKKSTKENSNEKKITTKIQKVEEKIIKPIKKEILSEIKTEKSIISKNITTKNINKKKTNQEKHFIGKRKRTVARVWIKNIDGNGKITINGKNLEMFFGPRSFYINRILEPFKVTEFDYKKCNIIIKSSGGGLTGACDAARLAISKALIVINSDFRKILKQYNMLTRDQRVVQSKVYGKRKARKKEQYSKR